MTIRVGHLAQKVIKDILALFRMITRMLKHQKRALLKQAHIYYIDVIALKRH